MLDVGARSPLRDGLDRINTSQAANPAVLILKAANLVQDRVEAPPRQSTPVDVSKSAPTKCPRSLTTTSHAAPLAPEAPEEPAGRLSSDQVTMSSSERESMSPLAVQKLDSDTASLSVRSSPVAPAHAVSTAPRTARASAAERAALMSASNEEPSSPSTLFAVADPVWEPVQHPILDTASSSARLSSVVPPRPVTPPQAAASTSTSSTGLSAIDRCMTQSYQALVQNAPEALTDGQEITLKIGGSLQ
ncbi:hypothetical protein NCC49_004525 [Naganishia albida]|nr:hypothetical protein NCC49_004525 [Naganishia albida]